MPKPNDEELKAIVDAHFTNNTHHTELIEELIKKFLENEENETTKRATDQLLNTIYILTRGDRPEKDDEESIKKILLRDLNK